MASIFSRIIAGEIPCYKVAENEQFFAFLDINPLAKGHTLVVPKLERDYIFDLDDKMLQDYILFAKKVAAAIMQVIPCQRVGLAVIGLDVPHAHIHLVPLNTANDINFAKPKLSFTSEEMQLISDAIHDKVIL
ncbi:HIT family protein [Microbacter margulisiae]|uniref:Histidine triad (HIT) family protein n=1 Tax=Microbacter margulisiae TaxID=1350067 RepID=A0A7W5H1L0_9PORP|nr:HIT family protein [Microbacter margulisiae]MBB3186486.1 histidine triad (HIT) family protein [Microbacter margulisiae]